MREIGGVGGRGERQRGMGGGSGEGQRGGGGTGEIQKGARREW